MLDPFKTDDRSAARPCRQPAGDGVSASQLTLAGLRSGWPACRCWRSGLWLGAGRCLANRLIDGLDGAVARIRGPTDFGGYADIIADMVFYAAVVLGFMARPQNAT